MNRSPNPMSGMSPETIIFYALVQGAGAATPVIPAPPTFPRGSVTTVKTVATKMNNYAASTTRSGVGVYTVVLSDGLPEILDIIPNVWGTDGKRAQIQDYNPVTRTISVTVFTAAGAAADLAATDVLRFTIAGQFSIFT